VTALEAIVPLDPPPRTGGDDLSGWGVIDMRLERFDYPLCQSTTAGALGPSPPDEALPLLPQWLYDGTKRAQVRVRTVRTEREHQNVHVLLGLLESRSYTVHTMHVLALCVCILWTQGSCMC
jgi:hypothetical protein